MMLRPSGANFAAHLSAGIPHPHVPRHCQQPWSTNVRA